MARKKHYNFYDDTFKATAVALTEIPGVLVKHVAEVLDIHEVMLYRWRMEMRRGELMSKKTTTQLDPEMLKELKRLKHVEREHERLKLEHEILKEGIRHSLQQKKKSSNTSK